MTRSKDTVRQFTFTTSPVVEAELDALGGVFGTRKLPDIVRLIIDDAIRARQMSRVEGIVGPPACGSKRLYVNFDRDMLSAWYALQQSAGIAKNPDMFRFLVRDAVRRYGLYEQVAESYRAKKGEQQDGVR